MTTWSHLCTHDNTVQHLQTHTHTHKTHTPLHVFPLCSPWDHLTLNSRHSLRCKHSRQQLNIQTNANQAMVKAHSGRIYVQKKREGVQDEETRLKQWVKVSAEFREMQSEHGILGNNIISRDANTSGVKITAQLALLFVTLTQNQKIKPPFLSFMKSTWDRVRNAHIVYFDFSGHDTKNN